MSSSPSPITPDTVAKIARLAKLRVTAEEQEVLLPKFNSILDWFKILQAVDVTGVAPMASPHDQTLSPREDVINDGDIASDLFQNAPDAQHGFFLVPKVVE